MLTRKHKTGDANPNLPLNYFVSEDGRSITIIDSIDSVMFAFIIHNINEINKTDQYILDGKSYFVELAVGNLVDEEGNEILDDDNNPLQDFYEEKVTGSDYTPDPIQMTIGSVGGSLSSSLAIMEAINNSKTPIELTFTENCMSGGTVIACAKVKKRATKYCRFLLHNLSTVHEGNFANLKDDFEESQYLSNLMKEIYKQNTKIPHGLLDDIFTNHKDVCFDSEKALEYGLIDEII